MREMDIDDQVIIGIDVGSTSVKTGAYKVDASGQFHVLEVKRIEYPDYAFECLEGHGYHQMNVAQMLDTIQNCVRKLNVEYRSSAKAVAICGQMHGIVLWSSRQCNAKSSWGQKTVPVVELLSPSCPPSLSHTNNEEQQQAEDMVLYEVARINGINTSDEPWTYRPQDETFVLHRERFSPFITWQDTRCERTFIEALNEEARSKCSQIDPDDVDDIDQLSSGFGLATALWLSRNDMQFLQMFDRCGTPMTILTSMLLSAPMSANESRSQSPSTNVIISDQMASSWGLYDAKRNCWRSQLINELGLPVSVQTNNRLTNDQNTSDTSSKAYLKLPDIVAAGTCLGKTRRSWLGLPTGTRVYVECGDLQCNANVCLFNHRNTAIINVSTSMQMAFVVNKSNAKQLTTRHDDLQQQDYRHIEMRPYFRANQLAVAASLNGGLVVETFIKFIKDTMKTILEIDVGMDRIWQAVIEATRSARQLTRSNPSRSMCVKPTLFGERHDPQATASICDIRPDNTNLAGFMHALCDGIVDNIIRLMPIQVLRDNQIEQVVCTGSVIQKNAIINDSLETKFRQHSIAVKFLLEADAQEGVARAVADDLTSLS